MERRYPNLCSPIKIGNQIFRNRMFSAPMGGTDITKEGCIGRGSTAFYELRSKGGAAAVTISECMVHPKTDGSHAYHLDLSIPNSLASFTYTADAITRHGAVASVELSHSGQFAGTYMTDKSKQHNLSQYGPSDGIRNDGVKVKAMSKEMIDDIVNSYGQCAILAKRAGFNMVMIHGGHGWLINQFLSPYFNKRTDEYGGSLENRVRFAQEVLDSVRKAVGVGFPIEFRMSGSELFDGGYTLEDGVEIAKLLENKIDLLHVSAGTYQKGFATTHPSMFKDHGCNVYLAQEIKKHVSIPVATIGALNSPQMMEDIIQSGKADVVEMARALLADNNLPRKVEENRDDEIVECLRCFVCMAERATTSTRRCAVNPLIGRELDGVEIVKSREPKKVLVAGGGIAGLVSALTASKRGHKVILCERSDSLGGILKGEQALDFKYEMYKLGVTYENLLRKTDVDIRLNTYVTKTLIEKENIDALIIAVGSKPIVPPIKSIDSDNVIIVNDYYKKLDKIGDNVVVLGGGLAGCEIAIEMANKNKKVSLVEMRDDLAIDANIRHRPILLSEIKEKVSIFTNLMGIEVTNKGLICKDLDGKVQIINGDTIVLAAGQKPRSEKVEELLNCAPFVRVVGDAKKARNITYAVYEGYYAALDI
ncbi:MAG: NAD(P)/FAD-dependent oxidoreductase [Sphaerochaetaceae bacterium]|nr:NAD(P)/FAD-dependent oxidoreductase [Sphaerochaetaceae bacterium]